jgi:hypothetical protein
VEPNFGTGGAVSVVLVVLSLLVAAGYVRIFRPDNGDGGDSSREATR